MNMSVAALARGAALLSALACAAAGLGACALSTRGASCQGAAGELRSLEEVAVLEARPQGAVARPVVPGPEGDSGCLGDSDPWLYAGRTYETSQSPETVVRFYREAAAADGWKEEAAPHGAAAEAAGLCFRRDGGRPRVLEVRFTAPAETSGPYRNLPGRGVYRVEAGSRADGAAAFCTG
ncbi:hypothetical protein ABZX75_31570 [Streptomyces sp. NPDC003038]|uniref:hypothetical protein n=1 Tax=unclassified Streptomyces TaxID=2593676 RepID=UPI0033A95309